MMTENKIENNKEILPSGENHSFDTNYAIAFGVNEAIMIRNLQHFIGANANRGHNYHDGRFWTYDRLQDFEAHFPYWSTQTIRTIIKSLISQGVLIKGDYNKNWSNRTVWYAFKDQYKFLKNIKPPKTPTLVPDSQPFNQEKNEIKKNNADLLISTNENCGNQQMTNVEIDKSIYSTTLSTTLSTTHTSLKVSKKPKSVSEFSLNVQKVINAMLASLGKHCPVYRPPADMTRFYDSVEAMIEEDRQDPDIVIDHFDWAVSDTEQNGDWKGWQGIIARNKKPRKKGDSSNPAEFFRDHLTSIYAKKRSKPQRKFAPCSRDDVGLKAMEEMDRTAL